MSKKETKKEGIIKDRDYLDNQINQNKQKMIDLKEENKVMTEKYYRDLIDYEMQ